MQHRTDDLASALSRRGFLGASAIGALSLYVANAAAAERADPIAQAAARLLYLTPPEKFREFEREKPPLHTLPPEKLRQIGLDRQTWKLQVIADPDSNAKVDHPLSVEKGTALGFDDLMKLAETRSVRYLKLLTCTNMGEPIGMGLWEGVPLRDVVWLAKPAGNVRRLFYWGYHHDDPKQRFVASVPIGRVLEDPPGELPIMLCYKLNGQWLSTRGGGPVRMIVPEAYGNKSVKWVTHIALSNSFQANDTYANWNNDVETAMKTDARFINPPAKVKAGTSWVLLGLAQVGMSGLSKVQYSLHPEEAPLPPEDPYFSKLDWRDARILPPPTDWGGGLPEGKLPPIPLQFNEDGRPRTWPLRYTTAHWGALVSDLRPGRYQLRCRTIDANGVAQPMPRPFPKAGNNGIQMAKLTVEPA